LRNFVYFASIFVIRRAKEKKHIAAIIKQMRVLKSAKRHAVQFPVRCAAKTRYSSRLIPTANSSLVLKQYQTEIFHWAHQRCYLSADGAFSVNSDVLRCPWLAMSASFTSKLPRKMHPPSSQILMEILG
jgi:hypothetical protein